MDDYNLSTLIDSKNEWCIRLTNILTPCLMDGIKSVFDEAYKICLENDEEDKYLMTFQNLLNNIPKWSGEIVNNEKERIVLSSACNYLEDLLTCVHITQLKCLTSTRVGIKQKKVNIDIPNINVFIHKAYINIARKIYVNVYLFERDIKPLHIQKNNREIELIIKECILNTIRDNIPVEEILKIYLDETQETEIEIEEKREIIEDKAAIIKKEKEEINKELELVKKEVKNKLEKETKLNLNKAIKEANKDLIEKGILKNERRDLIEEDIKDKENKLNLEKNNLELVDIDLDLDIETEKLTSDRDIDLDIVEL